MQLLRSAVGTMAEEASPGCPLPRLSWARATAWGLGLCILVAITISLTCHQQPQEAPVKDIAELQLNHTAPRKDPRLHWQGDPALGRSFLHGLQLENGQLQVRRDGVYQLHIQVTLANCSSSPRTAGTPGATLNVGVCSPAPRGISLLRLRFDNGCTVASQRLVPLTLGDTLCTNLTLSLLPSPNADETFWGVRWVCPLPLHLPA
ncbi:CD70 antigen [Erinaceus europaeus]|uniref:CD70 antigen n=1 Tax=Erinaceus europaeus TaxID=9365 RepID=A0ABM3WLC0_ERIEU|nr:CD70 antigen [Erinaceus europaeus]